MTDAFDALTDILDAETVERLGDPITYLVGGVTQKSIKAFVDHRQLTRQFGGAAAIDQEIVVQVSRQHLASKPGKLDRVKLPKYPGKTFIPTAPSLNETGTFWEFGLTQVPNA